MSDGVNILLQKALEFGAILLPMAVLWVTVVCLFALLYAGYERLARRNDAAARYRPTMLGLALLIAGAVAVAVCGIRWLDSLDAPVDIVSGHFSATALYFMAAAIVFDVGTILVLCSEVRDEAPSQTTT
jgi:hypothetical protein